MWLTRWGERGGEQGSALRQPGRGFMVSSPGCGRQLPCALNKRRQGVRGRGDPQSQGQNLPDNSPWNETSAWFLCIFVPVKWSVLKVPILPVICRQFGALNLTSART